MTSTEICPLIRKRQTKIVATLGPASANIEMIEKLVLAGVDVVRLNFSHGEHADHAARVKIIRGLETKLARPIAIIADLQGPKLRVGRFKDGSITLTAGQKLRLDLDKTEGDDTRVNLPHPEIINTLSPGAFILCDDGKVRMKIIDKGADFLIAEVVSGTKLSNNKGVNVPGVILPIPALTEKDRKDLVAALDMGVDWVAQSFVQRPEDVAEAKKLIGGRAALMAKIEKPSAIELFAGILDLVDGIMLARGDLGVEIPPEEVPALQKKIVRQVRQSGKPIIVATQMLESMIESPAPTRAEASDVATAVYDGTDAVMLSAETAAGKYPIESVSIMDRICQHVEADDLYRRIMDADHPDADTDASDAITIAACQVAQTINAACITNYTSSGSTTLRTARQRPAMPILCLSHSAQTTRRLMLSYGVHAVYTPDVTSFADAVKMATEQAAIQGLAKKGQRLVLTAGVPFGTPGSTNALRVAWVE
ncbi:pyruvate kinase [Micavibrio aeruginosavorus]|uniref:Pyruvate kinase n=1 Tax=Micavibrio aeruginosavorus (strain ARL-13) TaxID=856793 RepID=G2KMH0_MICAA|nr:pyruvate kinase [Micavibrio aeruginosavorus]AEP10663.1 pyruvate kinase [Micavibrio aeruginosavorus ARL-13]